MAKKNGTETPREGLSPDLALPDPLWQREAQGVCAAEAAEEFARTHWDKPRAVVWIDLAMGRFAVTDGTVLYGVRAGQVKVDGWPINLWMVYRLRELTDQEKELT